MLGRLVSRYTDVCERRALLAEESSHASQDAVFLWIIWVVFGGYLKEGREGGSVLVDLWSYPFGDLDRVLC